MSGWHVDKTGGQVTVVGPDGNPDATCGTFLDRLLLRGLSLHTVEAYAYDLVLMKRWLATTRVELTEMNSGHLHEFLAWERGRDSSPKSINRRLHTLRLFFHHVTQRELPGATVPRRGVRLAHRDRELGLQRIHGASSQRLRVKEPRRLVEPLTVEQVNELLGCLRRYRDLAIAYLMLLCGLRTQEVLNLRLTDIDLERDSVARKGTLRRANRTPRTTPHSTTGSCPRRPRCTALGGRGSTLKPVLAAGVSSSISERSARKGTPRNGPHSLHVTGQSSDADLVVVGEIEW